MISKSSEKEDAIKLRRLGKSYSEILREIKVAKSTLSLWFRSVNLSKREKQNITKKRLEGGLRGGRTRKLQRLQTVKKIQNEAENEIGKISSRELWLMGAMLYWAEGTKEKEWRPGSSLQFNNSDPLMISIYLKWLNEICGVKQDQLRFEIYIHETSKHRLPDVIKFWSRATNYHENFFQNIYFKRNKAKTLRKNIGDSYFGVLRIKVKASSSLLRKTGGWIKGICKNCGVVQG